ncbi:MAG: hypothetical protein QMD97_02635 [Candidatus Aenigmarchaeota archaeon]|nr:hypothetical protein [Candidatus Aenigmarchaeota archaeon]MDI6737322.1 hypothetical protein [Nanoarchaeota archaeon]
MKAKIVFIVLIVALLCTSIVSAGFSDWLTGKAVSLKSLFGKKAVSPQPAAAKSPVAVTVSSAEWSKGVKADQLAGLPDSAFWVHVENRLMQAENWMKQFDNGVRA